MTQNKRKGIKINRKKKNKQKERKKERKKERTLKLNCI